MPASVRAHVSRASSRPYDRRSPTASPAQSESRHLSRIVPTASPIQTPGTDSDTSKTPDTDTASEANVPPDCPGLPTHAEYKRIESRYLLSLSPRKRDKALITQAMFDKIWDVLHQPEACTIDTPQFRFWVRKMFTLSRPPVGGLDLSLRCGEERGEGDEADFELERTMGIGIGRGTADADADADADALGVTAVVLHENRPVAIMEQLYELFCYCHVRAGHGGRDKTCAVIREHYSWVPKELTAQFVKACPTCTLKRNGQGVDVGVFGHKRAMGRKRKGSTAVVEVPEETSVSVATSSLGWPTTGGPLDPANPEPCGVREREREWEREWQLRGLVDVGTVEPSSRASPLSGLESRTHSAPGDATHEGSPTNGRRNVPSTLAASPSEFGPCDATRSSAAEQRERSLTKTGPGCITTSAESLDEHSNTNLSGQGEHGDAAERLPRVVRLLSGVPSDAGPGLAGSSSYPLQIDPVLLSFSYPGLGLSSEQGLASDAADVVRLGLTLNATAGSAMSDATYEFTNFTGQSVYALRAPSDVSMSMSMSMSMSLDMPLPALGPSLESGSPDSSFESALALPYTPTIDSATATLPLSLSTEFMDQSRCGSRYGCRDGPLAMLYPCSVDEVGGDGPLSFTDT